MLFNSKLNSPTIYNVLFTEAEGNLRYLKTVTFFSFLHVANIFMTPCYKTYVLKKKKKETTKINWDVSEWTGKAKNK